MTTNTSAILSARGQTARAARRLLSFTATTLGCAALVALGPAQASSHREAPFITTQPKVDGTDFYMFRSYEPGRDGYVTLIANYLPLQDPYGGPNYFTIDPNALYEIHIDNNGDGREDITFQFRFKNELQRRRRSTSAARRWRSRSCRPARSTCRQLRGAQRPRDLHASTWCAATVAPAPHAAVTNAADGGATFDKPIDNIGNKTFGPRLRRLCRAARLRRRRSPAARRRARVRRPAQGSVRRSTSARSSTSSTSNPLGPRAATRNADALADKNVTSIETGSADRLPDRRQRSGHRRLDHGQRAAGTAPGTQRRPSGSTAPASRAAPGRRSRASACRSSTRS